MFTSASERTRSFCAPTFEPLTLASRPAITTVDSPVKVEACARVWSVDWMMWVVLDDNKPRFLL